MGPRPALIDDDGGRWRLQHKTELDVDKWSVDDASVGITRHK